MAKFISKTKYDFELKNLGYKVGELIQYFSLQGGVFSCGPQHFDNDQKKYTNPPAELLKTAKHSFPARITSFEFLEIFDSMNAPNETREIFEHDSEILQSYADLIKRKMEFPEDQDQCTILMVDINSEGTTKLPSPGEAVELIDMNQQSISPVFIGTIPSKQDGEITCLLVQPPSHDEHPVFLE